jgi:SulP family sulfate permease
MHGRQRTETEDLRDNITAMKADLAALRQDDESYPVKMPPMKHQISHSAIPDRYEHNHDPDQEEFRLIPAESDTANKWKRYLPITYWLPRYKWKEWGPMDAMAAITDIVMVIPQAMGYALVAGLPPINGLYSALMGHCLYSPFGSSGQLIVAPVAIVSLMTKETLEHYFHGADVTDPAVGTKMAAYGSALAFQSGVICLLLGFCKAGVLANMLAEPVIVGFCFAAAILIGISQLTFVFQIHVHGENVIEKLITFFQGIGHAHGASVGLAVLCIIFLLCVKFFTGSKLPGHQYGKFIPSALILVVVATSISFSSGTSTGWDIVGALPPGLPTPVNFFSLLDDGDFWSLWVPSILITILSFIESVAVAQKFADKHDYSIDASQELLALGVCNIIGCWFQIYPVSGVLSLATVVEAAGATTPLYGIIAGAGLIICCAAFLFLFEWLPKPVLGAIVFVGIMGLMSPGKIKHIYSLNRRDFYIVMVTILCTLFLGIDFGVALGVMASIVLFIQRAAKPDYSILGRVVDTNGQTPVYRNVKMYPSNTQKRGDMLMIRWDAPIFFANTASFKKRVKKHIGRFLEENDYPKPWCLVLDFSGVNDVDYSGLEMLEAFFEELREKERGMTLLLAKLKTPVLQSLTKGNIISEHCVPKEQVLWELHEAEAWWDRQLVQQGKYDHVGVSGMEMQGQLQKLTDNAASHGFATSNHTVMQQPWNDDEDEDLDEDVAARR